MDLADGGVGDIGLLHMDDDDEPEEPEKRKR